MTDIREIGLISHPVAQPVKAQSVMAGILRNCEGKLWIMYWLKCPSDALRLPGPAEPRRVSSLWETTCFELFVRNIDSPNYLEYNFSPSSEWAAYRFSDYREGMAEQSSGVAAVYLSAGQSGIGLEAVLTLPPEYRDAPIQIGLSAVIEETDGAKSYWALAHPPGKPDFHHKDCFALQLEAPSGA